MGAGMWPVDISRLLHKPRPRDDDEAGTIQPVPELMKIY